MVMARHYGIWPLTWMVVANMVGAGVFVTSGYTLGSVGSPHMVMVCWLVGGLIAMAGAVSYGELAHRAPESGGEYLFLTEAGFPRMGFVAGWVSIVAGFSGAIAVAATAFASYFGTDALPWAMSEDAVAVSVILIGGVLHGISAGFGSAVQSLVVVVKLLLLSWLVAAGLSSQSPVWTPHPEDALIETAPQGWALVLAMASSLVWISLSYSGFNAAVYVAGEAIDGRWRVPMAMFLGTILVTVLYWCLNFVFVYSAPPEQLANREDIANVAAAAIGGQTLQSWTRVIICVSMFTSVISMMMAAPRVLARMADDGYLPEFLAVRAGHAPYAAVAVQAVVASVVVLVSGLGELIGFLGLTLSLTAAITVGCLLTRRWRPPTTLRLVAPIIFIVATVILAILKSMSEPKHALATILTYAAGATMYYLVRGRRDPQRRPA